MFARHRLHPEGENDRDNRRQPFRDRRNGQANQREQQLPHRDITQGQAEDEQRHHHGEDNDENRFPQLIHLHQQRRAMLLDTGHHLVDVPKFRLLPGRRHHADATAGADGRTGKHHIGAVAQRQLALQRIGDFIHHR